MFSLLIVIGMLVLLFKITGFIFCIFGKILGIIFGALGYIILALLAVGVFGIAFFIIPVIAVAGIIAIISAIAKD